MNFAVLLFLWIYFKKVAYSKAQLHFSESLENRFRSYGQSTVKNILGNCDHIINAVQNPEGRINSPNYPQPYPNGLNCKWKIQAAKGRSINLTFDDFEITGTEDCQQDHLIIESRGISKKICGHQIPKEIITNGEDATVQFRTSMDGETCRGFSMQYSSQDVVITCGQKSTAIEFDFINPPKIDTLKNNSLECELTIDHSCEIPICQIRLDLVEFDLKSPTNGSCESDKMIVEANNPVPILCGFNTGQHIYAEVENKASTKIMMLIKKKTNQTSKWNVHVTQIPCHCDVNTAVTKRAPPGCLQYFEKLRGKIQSFNFNGKELVEVSCNGTDCHQIRTGMLNNIDYHICIKTLDGHCGIVYEEMEPNSFVISTISNGSKEMARRNLYGTQECKNNYIVIPKGRTPGDKNIWEHDRFCGQALGNCVEGPVISYSSPFMVRVKTEETKEDNRFGAKYHGFELLYTQLPCSSPYILRNHQRFPDL